MHVVGWVGVVALAWSASALAAPEISPILHDLEAGARLDRIGVSSTSSIGRTIDLIVSGSMTDADLESLDAVIGTRLPDGTRTIRIPVSRFGALRDTPGLTRITASYRCRMYNDVSVPLSGATPGQWTHTGGGVFAGNAGANVILGQVDSGIDWSHDDFKNPDGTTRILYIWDQLEVGSAPPGYVYGNEWTAAQINAGQCTHADFEAHGTHVMGIAAGDASATGNGQPAFRFIGMAPRADIIVVATDFSISHIIDGVNYIFQKAAAAGKDAVVNLSLGSQFGAHDGTETFDTSLNALTGPGRIIVAASGNEGGQRLHARQLVPPGSGQSITFSLPGYTTNGGAENDYVVIDAYYPGAANMNVTLTSPGPSPVTVGPVSAGSTASNVTSLAGHIYIENGFTASPSGDRNVYIEISDTDPSRPPRAGTWTLSLSPVFTTGATAFDAWLALYELGSFGASPAFTSDVDETDLIASPGSAAQLITAGAYISKAFWPSIDGGTHNFTGLTDVGAIADFSSAGPLRNGAIKPDLAAPGTAIVSASSAFASPALSNALINPDGRHHTEAGTSMASPHVAGAAALLLSATPGLTVAEIRTRLRAGAIVDSETGAVPNGVWGYGKLHMPVAGDVQAPTVTVTAPNGGESWAAGSVQNITWTAADNVGVSSITLEYSTNNGGSWSPVASGQVNDGVFAWTLPQTVSAQTLVRATAFDASANQATDASNAVFVVVDQTPPIVAVTSPVGGEIYGIGEARSIRWTSTDNIGVTAIDLSFSSDGGANWVPVANGEANDGVYLWTVPDSLTTNARVRVVSRDAASNSATAQSPASFTIQTGPGTSEYARPTLVGNHPNPSPGATQIGFGLNVAAPVKVRIYSLAGRLVRTVTEATFAAGYSEVTWDGLADSGSRAASGVYFCRFEAQGVDESRRIVLVQ